MGVIREFDGSDKFDNGILGFYDFCLDFIYDIFICNIFSVFCLRIYTYVSVITVVYFHIYAMSPIPHFILTVFILGLQKGPGGIRDDSIATIGSQFPIYLCGCTALFMQDLV